MKLQCNDEALSVTTPLAAKSCQGMKNQQTFVNASLMNPFYESDSEEDKSFG
jgi:hypothetical protein